MEFTSVFDAAGDDAEAEARLQAVTAAQVEAQHCWPFLALARSEPEFGHRLALSQDRLTTIAAQHGVSYEDVTAQFRTAFEAIHPKAADLAVEGSAVACKNCDHSNPVHSRGGLCPCGCESYQPQTHRSAAKDKTKRGGSYDPGSVDDLSLNGTSSNPIYYYNEGYDHGHSGADYKGYGGRDKAILYGHGYRHGAADADSKTSSLEERIAHLSVSDRFDANLEFVKHALAEGQDPLSWLYDTSAAPVPTHHDTTQSFEGTNPDALDAAMSNGGGSAQPENPGGHTTAPKVASCREAAKKEPVPKDSVCEHSGTRIHMQQKDGTCAFCKHPLSETEPKKATRESDPFS